MAPRRSLADLIADVPTLLSNLVRAEIDQLKSEMSEKTSKLGVGAGLLGTAAVLALFMLGWLLFAGYQGLVLVLPAWASALIVAGVLLVIAGILAAVGVPKLKQGSQLAPTETIESVKRDVNVIKGLGAEARGETPPVLERQGEP